MKSPENRKAVVCRYAPYAKRVPCMTVGIPLPASVRQRLVPLRQTVQRAMRVAAAAWMIGRRAACTLTLSAGRSLEQLRALSTHVPLIVPALACARDVGTPAACGARGDGW